MTEFSIIHQSPQHQRYVVFVFQEQKLFKIQPSSLKFIDTQIQEIVQDTKRFRFWEPTKNETLKDKIITFFKEKGSFDLFTSEFQGVSCERLLYTTAFCGGSHIEEKSFGMKISSKHIFKFIQYIIESFQILSDKGIEHRDINLSNIIVFPNEEEMKNKVLTSSLPVIIDFGLAQIVSPEIATKSNLQELLGLFFACRYGLCKLGEGNPIPWMIHAVTDEEPEIIERLKLLDKGILENNLTFESLLFWFK